MNIHRTPEQRLAELFEEIISAIPENEWEERLASALSVQPKSNRDTQSEGRDG